VPECSSFGLEFEVGGSKLQPKPVTSNSKVLKLLHSVTPNLELLIEIFIRICFDMLLVNRVNGEFVFVLMLQVMTGYEI